LAGIKLLLTTKIMGMAQEVQIRYDEKPESIKCYDLLPYIRPYSEIISELSLCK
jgi:hypothetical protein